jgi:hypothetical protein
MYPTMMIPMSRRNDMGRGCKPRISPSEERGKSSVATTTKRVAISRYCDGLLLKMGFRLRITSTISEAEITDSRNQPVLN